MSLKASAACYLASPVYAFYNPGADFMTKRILSELWLFTQLSGDRQTQFSE